MYQKNSYWLIVTCAGVNSLPVLRLVKYHFIPEKETINVGECTY